MIEGVCETTNIRADIRKEENVGAVECCCSSKVSRCERYLYFNNKSSTKTYASKAAKMNTLTFYKHYIEEGKTHKIWITKLRFIIVPVTHKQKHSKINLLLLMKSALIAETNSIV